MHDLFGWAALTSDEAFSGIDKARAGFKNHYFQGSSSDGGTWISGTSCQTYTEDPDTMKKFKAYVRQQCKYTPYEVETDTQFPIDDPQLDGQVALKEMIYQRVSNCGIEFNLTMLQRWKNDGVFNEMSKRLGYRFRLISANIPKQAKQGSTFQISFVIRNDGFATPYNPRDLELVLKSKKDNSITRLKMITDPRRWLPDDDNIEIKETLIIPANMASGEYALYLNLPDPEPLLNDKPEYSIRLANKNVWDSSLGYNSLLTNLIVL
jgi:hypothetical protein